MNSFEILSAAERRNAAQHSTAQFCSFQFNTIKKLLLRGAFVFIASLFFILPNNIGFSQILPPWTSQNPLGCGALFTTYDDYVGIGPFSLTPLVVPKTKLHLFLPWTSYAAPPLCLATDLRNSILLETGYTNDCNSFAEFGIWRNPENLITNPKLSTLAGDGDAVLRTYGTCSNDLIINTQNQLGKIRFATRENDNGDDFERMTVTNYGIGIWNPNPTDALSIGSKLNMHIGTNYDYVGYNVYVDVSGNQKYTQNGFASCLKFRNEWNQTGVLISEPFPNNKDYIINFSEECLLGDAAGGEKGYYLGIGNSVSSGTQTTATVAMGIGSGAQLDTRLFIRSMGNDNSTNYSFRIENKSGSTLFSVKDKGNIGIGTTTLNDKVILDINSTNKGVLVPRMSYNQRNQINPTSTETGLLIYQNNSVPGFYYYDGSTWLPLSSSNTANTGWQIDGTKNIITSTSGYDVVINNGANTNKLVIGTRCHDGTGLITSSNLRLSVDGAIVANELLLDLANWSTCYPDYVFNSDYDLMPLDELEKQIKTNKHLPGIPTATEAEKNGVNVGDMQNQLLLKIEELTLYVIDLQKQCNELKKQLEQKSNKE